MKQNNIIKVTKKEKEIIMAIKNQLKNMDKTIMNSEQFRALIIDKEGIIIRNKEGWNNINLLDHCICKHPLCSAGIEISKGQIITSIYTDAGFDICPDDIKEFLIEFEILLANKNRRRALSCLEEVDSELVEKYGFSYVIVRLEWLNTYCHNLLKNDNISERLEELKISRDLYNTRKKKNKWRDYHGRRINKHF